MALTQIPPINQCAINACVHIYIVEKKIPHIQYVRKKNKLKLDCQDGECLLEFGLVLPYNNVRFTEL